MPEWVRLESLRTALLRDAGLRAGRGLLERAGIAVAVADVEAHGADAGLVSRLQGS